MKYVLAKFSTQHLEVNDCIESERKDIEQRIVMENENGRERWNLMGNRLRLGIAGGILRVCFPRNLRIPTMLLEESER
jgi:hypothetical protein